MYPEVSVRIIPGATLDLLEAIHSGDCSGGVVPNVHLRNALSVQDTAARYCSLAQAGSALSNGFFGIPLSRDVSAAEVAAMSTLLSEALVNGTYAEYANTQFPTKRPYCLAQSTRAAARAVNAKPQVDLGTVAGTFVVQAIGIGVATVLLSWKWAVSKLREDSLLGHLLRMHRMVRARPRGWPPARVGAGAVPRDMRAGPQDALAPLQLYASLLFAASAHAAAKRSVTCIASRRWS